jgi:hypothetical protein
MGRKIVRILVVGVLTVTSAFALREPGDQTASATNHASRETRLRSARGLGVSIILKDYTTRQQLDCGGTYTIQSWVWGVVRATSRTSGLARLVYRTNENGSKYWNTKAGTVYLTHRSSVIGAMNQWPDRGGDTSRYRFTVQLYRQSDPNHSPQASIRCTVTVSRAP